MNDEPKKGKTAEKRSYVVLEQEVAAPDKQGRRTWRERGSFEASSESGAKRQAITKSGKREYGALVAVARWNPTVPTVTAETVLKIEGI